MREKKLLNSFSKKGGTPIWFMRQAGRYLPEYRSIRETKKNFLDMVFDSETSCEITLQPIRRFGFDGAILFSDILTIPYALGQDVKFQVGEGPVLSPIPISELSFEHFQEKLNPVYQTVHLLQDALKKQYPETTLIGFSGAPWTLAAYMIEGQGSRSFEKAQIFAMENPKEFKDLMDILVKACSEYLIQQVQHGAEVLQIFDSWGGVVPWPKIEDWMIQPTRVIIENIKKVYPDVPIIAFPKGIGCNFERYVMGVRPDGIGLDPTFSILQIREILEKNNLGHMVIQGNLDPIVLLSGGDLLDQEVDRILKEAHGCPFIFNLGHGILQKTPISHVERVLNRIRKT